MESGIWEGQAEAETPAKVTSYRDLEVFQRSLSLVKRVHDIVRDLPGYERFDLVQQMRRASKSVPANIAEGFGRRLTPRDYRVFLSHALGSANEMQVHLLIAKELGYADSQSLDELHAEYDIVARQLNRLMSRWR